MGSCGKAHSREAWRAAGHCARIARNLPVCQTAAHTQADSHTSASVFVQVGIVLGAGTRCTGPDSRSRHQSATVRTRASTGKTHLRPMDTFATRSVGSIPGLVRPAANRLAPECFIDWLSV